jgi:hypothetical protein
MKTETNMCAPFTYVHVYTGSDGESHIDRLDIAMSTVNFAPPAPPLDLSEPINASQVNILRLSPEWQGEPGDQGEWHNSPVRQWLFYLAGTMILEVSDGSSVSLSPGSVVLIDDSTGKGHRDRLTGNTEVIIAAARE